MFTMRKLDKVEKVLLKAAACVYACGYTKGALNDQERGFGALGALREGTRIRNLWWNRKYPNSTLTREAATTLFDHLGLGLPHYASGEETPLWRLKGISEWSDSLASLPNPAAVLEQALFDAALAHHKARRGL
jgi:hypothetical protein